MYKYLIFLILLFLFSQSAYSYGSGEETNIKITPDLMTPLISWKYNQGDNEIWSQPEYNDEQWGMKYIISGEESDNPVIWFRKKITIFGNQNDTKTLTLFCIGLAKAYEIYWDGHLIAKNGNISNDLKNNISGTIIKYAKLKPHWAEPGNHLLAIRASNNFPRYRLSYQNIYLCYYSSYSEKIASKVSMLSFMTGFNFIVIILCFSFFLIGGRHRSYLYFGLYRFCFMLYAIFEIFMYQFSMTMAFTDVFFIASYILDPIAYIFLSLYVIFNFNLPKKNIHFILNLFFFILFYSLWGHQFTMLLLLYPMGMTIWAVKNKKQGSVLAFIGLAVLNITSLLAFFIPLWYEMIIGNIVFVCLAMLSISRQVRAQEQEYEISKLKSSRLEAQLLKKNIQPHFLMNTLLTIISLIKKDPDKAIKLIQALAAEFRMINKISSQKVIPISDEITLCKKHLELMGFRKKARYNLTTNNIDNNEKIPPMIFHTLIENGLTHAYEACEDGMFILSCKKNNGYFQYCLANNGSQINIAEIENDNQFEEGMGMRYVKARLDESFPDKWKLTYGQNNNLWEVNIMIKQD